VFETQKLKLKICIFSFIRHTKSKTEIQNEN